MEDVDNPIWWCMCGNEGSVTIYGPYDSREVALGRAGSCPHDTAHHYMELSMRQLAARLPRLKFDGGMGYAGENYDREVLYIDAPGLTRYIANFTSQIVELQSGPPAR